MRWPLSDTQFGIVHNYLRTLRLRELQSDQRALQGGRKLDVCVEQIAGVEKQLRFVSGGKRGARVLPERALHENSNR
jgi:hypothetical protein